MTSGPEDFRVRAKTVKARAKITHLPTYLQEEDTPRVNSEPFYRAAIKSPRGVSNAVRLPCSVAQPAIAPHLLHRQRMKLLVAGGVREVNIVSHDFTDYGWDLRRKIHRRRIPI